MRPSVHVRRRPEQAPDTLAGIIPSHHPGRSFDLSKQSIAVPNSAEEGYSPIYRNSAVPYLETTETYYEVFNIGREKSHDRPFLGWRAFDAAKGTFATEYSWLTYDEVEERRTAIGSGLANLASSGALGIQLPQTHWTVGIWCQNRPGESA